MRTLGLFVAGSILLVWVGIFIEKEVAKCTLLLERISRQLAWIARGESNAIHRIWREDEVGPYRSIAYLKRMAVEHKQHYARHLAEKQIALDPYSELAAQCDFLRLQAHIDGLSENEVDAIISKYRARFFDGDTPNEKFRGEIQAWCAYHPGYRTFSNGSVEKDTGLAE